MADEKTKAVVCLSSQNNAPTSHNTQLSLSDKKEFNRCILTARELEKNGKLFEALNLYKKALLIRKYDPAISKKIAKLEAQYRMTVSEANEPEKDEQDDEQETMASNEQEKSQNTTDGEATTSKRSTRQSGQRNFYDIKDIKPYASTMVKGEPRVISQIPPFEIGAVSGDIYLGELAIPRAIADRLYDFQRDGLRWMWSLHSSQPSGGILAVSLVTTIINTFRSISSMCSGFNNVQNILCFYIMSYFFLFFPLFFLSLIVLLLLLVLITNLFIYLYQIGRHGTWKDIPNHRICFVAVLYRTCPTRFTYRPSWTYRQLEK